MTVAKRFYHAPVHGLQRVFPAVSHLDAADLRHYICTTKAASSKVLDNISFHLTSKIQSTLFTRWNYSHSLPTIDSPQGLK
jgi:hypothetical protein